VWSRDDRGPSGAKGTKRRVPGEPGKAAHYAAGRSVNKLADPTGHDASPPAEASLDARHIAFRSSPHETRKFAVEISSFSAN